VLQGKESIAVDIATDEGREIVLELVRRADAVLQSLLVEEALGRLTNPHREVLLECYFRGSSVAQAAAVLGIPAGTVKSRAHYALHALKLVLEEMGVVM